MFRGISDLAGGEPTWSSKSLMNLSSINTLKVAVEFIATIGRYKLTPSVPKIIISEPKRAAISIASEKKNSTVVGNYIQRKAILGFQVD